MPAGEHRTVLNGSKFRSRRRRAQRPTLAAIAALAFVLGGIAAGILGNLGAVSDAAVRDTFEDVPASERVFQLSARVADNPGAQHDTAIAAFERFVGDAAYDVHRSLLTEPRQLLDPDAPQAEGAAAGLPRLSLAAYESLPEHADLVAGEWPADSTDGDRVPVALHESAATALGIAVGDELAFEERRRLAELVVVGIWRPSDPDADYWFANSFEQTGMAGEDGLAVLAERDLLETPGPVPVARWRLSPDVESVALADLSELRVGLPRIRPYLADDPLFRNAGIGVDDEIIKGLDGTDNVLLASRSVVIAPLLLGVLAAIGAIGLMSRLLSENRRNETLLMRGRGWSRGQAIGWAVRESGHVFVLPAVLGGAVGYGALRLLRGTELDVPLSAVATGTAVLVVAGVGTLVIAAARVAAPAHTAVERRATAGRRQVAGRAGLLVLVFASAALATWQLLRFDGVTVFDSAGIRQLAPLAVAAPAAILLAAAVVVTGLMVLLGRIGERVLDRRRGLAGVHAARVLSRRSVGYVLPVVLIGLAAGSGTFAAAYSSTWHDLQNDVAAERTPADIEVGFGGPRLMTSSVEPVVLADYEAIDGVVDVAAAMDRSAHLGDGEIGVVATGDPEAANGIELPAGEQSVEVEIAGDLQLFSDEADQSQLLGSNGEPVEVAGNVQFWLVDADGFGGVVDAGSLRLSTAAPDSQVLEFELPPNGGVPWQIVAADIRLELPVAAGFQADFTLSIADVRTGGSAVPVPHDGWSAVTLSVPERTSYSANSPGRPQARMIGNLPAEEFFRVDTDLTTRLVHGAAPVAATATEAALDTSGLRVGDDADLEMFGNQIPMSIAGSTASLPGADRPEAISVELHSLVSAVLHSGGQPPAPDRVWASTDPTADQAAIAGAAAELAGPESTVSSRAVVAAELVDRRLSQLVVTTFWLVAGVAAGLAAIGTWAAGAYSLGTRRTEVSLLRALGCSPAQQGRQRGREMLLLGALATVLGAASGYVAGWIVIPPLAGSATPELPDSVEPVVAVEWTALAGFVTGLLAVLVMIVAGYGRQVRRQAGATHGMEVTT